MQGEGGPVTGTLALIGGGEFAATEAVDRRAAGPLRRGSRVVVLPTADAFERPERVRDPGRRRGSRRSAWRPGGSPCSGRPDAFSPEHVAAVRESAFTYLVGDSPMHLRSVLKDTPLWEALVAAVAGGAVVAASGPAAMALCDPMTDPRGGAFTLGLGLARPMAVVPGGRGLVARPAASHPRPGPGVPGRDAGHGRGRAAVARPAGRAGARRSSTWPAPRSTSPPSPLWPSPRAAGRARYDSVMVTLVMVGDRAGLAGGFERLDRGVEALRDLAEERVLGSVEPGVGRG